MLRPLFSVEHIYNFRLQGSEAIFPLQDKVLICFLAAVWNHAIIVIYIPRPVGPEKLAVDNVASETAVLKLILKNFAANFGSWDLEALCTYFQGGDFSLSKKLKKENFGKK